jgi:tetratricopeptide (TPR) repeat protein
LLGDPLQGFVKDWDVFAAFGVLYTGASAWLLTSAVPNVAVQRRLLMLALVTSVLHTAGWVTLNTSESSSLERMKVAPVSRGRNEFTVGYWYLTHHRDQDAEQWFIRAVDENPGNNAAHYHLGLLALDAARYEEAVDHFRVAVSVRPDKDNYRVALIDGLVMARRPAEALPELEHLLSLQPRRASWLGAYAILLLGVGSEHDAQAALDSARAIAPGDQRLAALGKLMKDPDGYQEAVVTQWFSLIWERPVPGPTQTR